MKVFLTILLCLFSSAASAQTNCLQTAREIPPQLSAETQRDFETKLSEARELFEKEPRSAERIVWLGRRTAYLGRYKDSIKIYTDGIKQFPSDARLYRHRGHRFITLRCFDAAIADFEKAAKLITGKPDEVEPDGLPNARNIPTSTLQSNIWYHLGLAHYLKRDFPRALKAYREAEKVSKNPDMLVATTHWLYMTLRRLGQEQEASKALMTVRDDLEVIENTDYYRIISVYKGKLAPAEVLKDMGQTADSLGNASIGYGLGNWFLYNGQREEAEKIFRRITAGNQWASFGYIAAESELKSGHKKAQRTQLKPADSIFIFHTDEFWLNLHHFLYVLGRAQNKTPDAAREAVSGAPADQDQALATLSAAERNVWNEAVAAYAAGLSKKDMVFDDALPGITKSLALAGDARSLTGIDPSIAAILERAAPIYRKAWWSKHKGANQAWRESIQRHVDQHGSSVLSFITRVYQSEWPKTGYPVHVSAYANWAGAYSTEGNLLVVASLNEGNHGVYGLESVFHEAMHQWDAQVSDALAKQARLINRQVPRNLSHALLFFTAGEAIRRVVPGHVPSAEKFGVWQRGLMPFKQPLEQVWKPYLDGQGTRDEAFAELIKRTATEPKR